MANKIDPARLAAYRVLHDVMTQGAFSNLSAAFHLADPALDARDRAFATAMIYGTLARLPLIDAWIKGVSSIPFETIDERVLQLLRLGVWQLHFSYAVPPHAAVDETVRLTRLTAGESATSFVNGILRRLARETPPLRKNKRRAYELGLSTELFGLLRHWYGDDFAVAIATHALTAPETITVRRNCLCGEAFERWLTSEEALATKASPAPWPEAAWQLALQGHPVDSLSGHRAHLFSVQSASAMLAGTLCPLPQDAETARVLDLCAAPGGKTAHLAERLGAGRGITACDVSPERLAYTERALTEAGFEDIVYRVLDATEPLPFDEPFSLVLCDVPCSGLGLLGRRPEIRLRMDYEAIQRLLPIQAAILKQAAAVTAPGGILLYTTCTVNPEENGGQIRRFLASPEGADFTVDDLRPVLPTALRATYEANREPDPNDPGGDVTLFAHRDGSDGFYLARLRRRRPAEA